MRPDLAGMPACERIRETSVIDHRTKKAKIAPEFRKERFGFLIDGLSDGREGRDAFRGEHPWAALQLRTARSGWTA